MKLSEELEWRGFVNHTTFSNLTDINDKKWTFYHGIDPSADSLTIGNLAAIMLVKLFIRHGSTPVLLAGGATSLIGDPGGKDIERPMQSEETIKKNVSHVEKQVKEILDGVKVVNNLDWYKNMNVLDFLRDVGKHFSMTPLVQRDYIANRMGEDGVGISFTEFSYTLLQGYDYLYLNKNHAVNLQLAGSDQWGNCLSGVELIRKVESKEVHALTMPLIINHASGKKFGKSEENAVWLDPKKTSPTKFYQFWINLDDESISHYLKIYTDFDKYKISDIMTKHEKNPDQRLAQSMLARSVTELVHGSEQSKVAVQVTKLITGQSSLGDVDKNTLEALKNELPYVSLQQNKPLIEILVDTGLARSNTEARRLVESGAIYVNNLAVNTDTLEVKEFVKGVLIIRRGKAYKDSALVILG
jgi:tyrosyl-tRNA synthetase